MPWPFRKREKATEAAAAAPAVRPGPPPITAADLAPPRLAVPVPRAWAALPPMERSIAPPSAGLVAPQASFVHDVAGTRPLVLAPILRQVTSDAPAGRADDIVAAGRSLSPSAPEGGGDPGAGRARTGVGTDDVPRRAARPLAGRSRSAPAARRLDTYEGELRPYERPEPAYDEWPQAWGEEGDEEPDPDGIPEELPPPIFSALLAERTGQSLAELRPDLVDADGNIIDPRDTPPAPPRRRKTLAESRRAGLGVPEHSGPAGGDEPGAPADGPSEDEPEDEEIVEVLTAEELFAGRPSVTLEPEIVPVPEPELAVEPELELEPERAVEVAPAERRPTLRFRAAPGAPVRRMPAPGASTLTQTAPTDVREAVARATGMDPGPTTVRRGPEASAEAMRIGAAAFTRDGEIFLPAEHGPLDGPATRALLAHELTHVVQHRVYGDRLPRPDSAPGRRLEAEARSVQRWVAGVDEAPRARPAGTSGSRPADSQLGELRETADELVTSGLAHWAPDGSLVFGGGAMGGTGDQWMAVADSLAAATTEDHQLYQTYDEQRLAGLPHEDSEQAYMEYHKEYMERYGGDLQNLASTAGTGTGTSSLGGAGTSAADLKKQLENLKAPVDPNLSYEDATKGQGWGWGTMFQDPAVGEYEKKKAEHKEKKDELEGKIAKATKAREDHEAAATTATATAAVSNAVAKDLIHAPNGDKKTTGLEKTDAEKADEPLSESKRLEQQMKDDEALWKLNEEMAKLEGTKPVDPSMSYEEAQAARGGGGGWGWGSLFADPDKAKAQTELDKFEKDKKHLEDKIELQTKIEAARKKEQDEKTTAAEAAKKKDADAKSPDAKDAKTLLDAEADADLTKAAESSESAEASTAATRVLDHLDDEDVEELATLLYGRLVTRLRQDLIIDRERAGLLTDFR